MIDFNTLPLVAKASMNQTHYDEVELINSVIGFLEKGDVTAVDTALEALVAHTVEHFSGEEAMMRERAFPPYLFHKSEHDQALALLKQTQAAWSHNRNTQALLDYFHVTLATWLKQHIATMDTVTAAFLETGLSPCSVRG